MRRLAALLTGALVSFLALAGVPTAGAQSLPAAATCSGVWVVVDYGDLGGISTECATDFGTGTKALKSAGFSPTLDNGMIVKIDGKPDKPDIQKSYWSYWHAEQKADGSFGAWEYSNKGAGSYKPTKGNAEGWRYQDLADGKVKPGAKPPAAEPKPTPKPSETAKPKPSETAKPKPSPKPSETVKPTPSRTPSASPTTSPSPSGSPSATPTPTEIPSASPIPSDTTSPAATPTPEPPSEAPPSAEPAPSMPDSGSPVAAIVAGIVVVGGGGGAGLWWWLKGRHR
ncbi:MAG: hypothetical protein QM628_07230 [Propionicimonas sp.]